MEVAQPKERKKPINEWPDDHSDWLREALSADQWSYAELTRQINSEFETSYTKNAVLGRAHRMGFRGKKIGKKYACKADRIKARRERVAAKRKAARWAANPSLATRTEDMARREREREQHRLLFKSRNTTTSAAYRKYLPRLPKDTSRSALRDMIAEAVRNTAAMELT